MTIPFRSYFLKAKACLQKAPPENQEIPPVAPLEKPSSDRLRKTVMPNMTRVVIPTSALGVDSPIAAAPSRLGCLPPTVLFAVEPAVERTISLELSDIIGKIAPEYLKPDQTPDAGRRILLQASAIEKGMATGKPTIALAVLYEQVPEIFAREIAPSDSTETVLPYEKVLEQFNTARVREDQLRDSNVPQVDTPILKATIEDTARFGTKVELLQGSALPPVKVQPATARSISEAEPETILRDKAQSTRPKRSTIPLTQSIPLAPPSTPKPEPQRAQPAAKNPARIPFNLPPNGAGASASERVPALSGPPVPIPPPPGRLATKGRLPGKVAPPSDDLRPKLTLVPGVERKEEAPETSEPAASLPPSASAAKADTAKELKVGISLRLVLENVPPFQLHGNVSDVPADVCVEFPLSLIQPQLAAGRIAIAPKVFRESIPESFRQFFVVDEEETAVHLPLQEVLKNLPGEALKMRGDQEQVAVGEIIETPFSIKAKEDAERFSAKPAPLAPTAETTGKIDSEKSAESPAGPPASKEGEKLDAKEVVARATELAGVLGCSVTFSDGLIVAQKFPAGENVEGLCAAAPSLRQRIEQHACDTSLGALKSMTLQGEKSAISFFMKGNVCLTTLHPPGDLAADTQTKLAEMAEQLTRIYAQPETGNVDH